MIHKAWKWDLQVSIFDKSFKWFLEGGTLRNRVILWSVSQNCQGPWTVPSSLSPPQAHRLPIEKAEASQNS